MAPGDDPLRQGVVSIRHHGTSVSLDVAHGTFSAATVDPGTRFLLRWLADVGLDRRRRVLDLGSGYGPLAVLLAAADADRTVDAVDRDAVAVAFTAANAVRNGVGDRVRAVGSLGYDAVADRRYDLVVSNVPAKVGDAALAHLLLDAVHVLAPDGVVAIVVVDRLAEAVGGILEREPAVVVHASHANRGYRTFTYGFAAVPARADAAPGFDRGVYRRTSTDFAHGHRRWRATTSYTLAEFDTLGHATLAALDLLDTLDGHEGPEGGAATVFVGVGQGHLPTALGAPATRLVDRDLLALRTAAANVDAPTADVLTVDVHHVDRPAGCLRGADLAVVGLPEKEPVAVTAALLRPALAELDAGARLVLHGRSADVSRVAELLARTSGSSSGPRLRPGGRCRHGRHAAAGFVVTPPA